MKWDYKQILAHYYTGIDFINDNSGDKIAPDYRWNLLNHDIPKDMQFGATYNVTLTLQNTSTMKWNAGDISLGWTLASPCQTAAAVPSSDWISIPLPEAEKGHPSIQVPVTIRAAQSGMRMLYIDLKRPDGTWFRDGQPGGWPYLQIPIWVASSSNPANPQAGLYPYGLVGCYYNDETQQITEEDLGQPIFWDTFTQYKALRLDRQIDFDTGVNPPLPGVNGTFWSARWLGKLYVPQTESYKFFLEGLDDGGRLYIDQIADGDTPIIESWLVQGPHGYSSSPVTLDEGLHHFRVDYAQGPPSYARLKVAWLSVDSDNVPYQTIKAAAPSPYMVTIQGNAGIGGAVLHYIDGVAKTAVADASGNYTLSVSYGWSGPVTPALPGYKFTPVSKTYEPMYFDQWTITPDYAPTAVPVVTVTSLNDSGSGSLREAINSAQADATIVFAPALSGGTIQLNSTLTLTKPVTIDGSALPASIVIRGDKGNTDPTDDVLAFKVNLGVIATLNHLIITKAKTGIYNEGGSLTVRHCTFSNNATADWGSGGGISNTGALTVTDSTFSNNSAVSSGGGIATGRGVIASSTFSNNSAASYGGGLYNTGSGPLTITNSTFSGNTASISGGGLYNSGSNLLTLTNSTFSGNTANTSGGGIHNSPASTLTITNSTFSGNAAPQGGGLYNGGTLNYANTILANSPSGRDCYNAGTLATNTNNLVEDNYCSPFLHVDPGLGSLANNGGPTQTLALLAGSPALNAGDDAACANAPVYNRDQRGVFRPQGAHCDIGAFEAPAQITISGNAGAGGVTLSYVDSTTKTVTTDGSGNYSISVPYNWSGTVTPAKTGYTFSPPSLTYTSLQGDQLHQSYSVTFWPAWAGGLSLTSDQPVVAVARPHVGSEVMSYSGLGSGSTTIYIPMLFKNAFGGDYDSAIYLQNTSNTTANLSLVFIDSTGAVVYTKTDSLASNASKGYWLPSEAGLPTGFAGAARVDSSQPVSAVGRVHIGTQVMTYNGIGAGATTAYLPMFFKDGFGNYNTALYIQNVTANAASLTIKYLNLDGTVACTDNDTLAANAAKGYWSLSVVCDSGSLPSGFVGGVKVSSTQNILAVGRAHLGDQITTYNGVAVGSTSVYVPMLFKNAFGGSYNAALYVQNVSEVSTNATIEYLNGAGTVAATQNITLAAGAISSLWLPSLSSLPDGFAGGTRITASQNIVAVGRPHVGNEIMAYNGIPAGSLTAWLPMLFKDAFGGSYDAAFYIQNTSSGSPANVILSFFDTSGQLSCLKTVMLPALGSGSYWLPDLACTP